ncbi:D-alanyl-D-alanine carboxypeptidase (penicillin-binding protein 5/6) [Oribacterium sp. WCC10]|nr:D-alanyl-D-alanine carboxypeptidase (penicillin-binding protein 5/6) [Oribacterium sp. WCC10]
MALPVLLCLLTLSGCGQKLEQKYDADMGLMRMNSINMAMTETSHADGFSVGLALPGETTFNADEITAQAALIVPFGQEDPQPVAYKNPYVRTYPASITKVMSALVCLRHFDDLQQEFTVTKNSDINVSGSSKAWIRPGETLTIEDLLYGMLLPSGNDAAVAIAEATCGSVDAFVDEMNQTALEIGATGTHFVNPHGLPDDNHYTTPYDIYLTMNEVMKYDAFRKIVGTVNYSPSYKDSNGMPKTQNWSVTNRYMLGEVETPEGLKVLGGKTGTTNAAGYCLTMGVQKTSTGEEYISTVMKAETKDELYKNMTNLISKAR